MSNQTWHARLQATMPWGSSTCSKAAQLSPEEPSVIVKGEGCRVWDADGREYIDFRYGLGPVTLGYRYPAVDAAIHEQLKQGIIYGHPHPIECEVAERICELIPCAEQARFLKTGGEAIAACIRLARAATGRDHIIQIGYNGWLNSLTNGGPTLPRQLVPGVPPGVPQALSELHHSCGWNDFDALSEHLTQWRDQVAAIVVAADYADMAAGEIFYPRLRELADAHGALLIYDEIVTGFRVAIGGVQEHFQTPPDLAVFAKGIANGMPLAVYCGRRDLMSELEHVIVSSTYGGETLSLAAANATIDTYCSEGVIDHFWRQGERWMAGLNQIFADNNLNARASGMPPCPALLFDDTGKQTSFLRACFRHGVSLFGVTYINYSHRREDIDEALERVADAAKEVA